MADEKFDPEIKGGKGGGVSSKVILLGIPLFIIQLVAVYFIVAYLLESKQIPSNLGRGIEAAGHVAEQQAEEGFDDFEADTSSAGNFVYSLDDLMMNPAGTNGQAIMLVSLGFDIGSETMRTTMETKEVLVRDMVITTLSGKTLDELAISNRDSLRLELADKVESLFNNVRIKRVYFSKFIIQ